MTNTERVRAMRLRRAELGLKRLDVYAPAHDHPAIKAFVEKLKALRQKGKS